MEENQSEELKIMPRGTAPRYAPSDARRKGGRDAGRPAAGRNFRPAQKKGRAR